MILFLIEWKQSEAFQKEKNFGIMGWSTCDWPYVGYDFSFLRLSLIMQKHFDLCEFEVVT